MRRATITVLVDAPDDETAAAAAWEIAETMQGAVVGSVIFTSPIVERIDA